MRYFNIIVLSTLLICFSISANAVDVVRYLIAGDEVPEWAYDLAEADAAMQNKDYGAALIKYKSAAAKNSDEARYDLGTMYESGKGVTQDYAEAIRWLRLSASQGNTNAQNYLSYMYETGKGVTQDYIKAYMWSNLAAINGDITLVKNRDAIALKLTHQQISESQKLASECQKSNFKKCN
jgi:uncharacterized protein